MKLPDFEIQEILKASAKCPERSIVALAHINRIAESSEAGVVFEPNFDDCHEFVEIGPFLKFKDFGVADCPRERAARIDDGERGKLGIKLSSIDAEGLAECRENLPEISPCAPSLSFPSAILVKCGEEEGRSCPKQAAVKGNPFGPREAEFYSKKAEVRLHWNHTPVRIAA